MSEINLGRLLERIEERDAIHIAIFSARATQDLERGDHVGFPHPDDKTRIGKVPDPIGIVDPFLKRDVPKGSICQVMLYPNTIQSLRHEWAHPAFEDVHLELDYLKSLVWIDDFAGSKGLGFEELVDATFDHIRYGTYLNKGGLLEGEYVPPDYWPHFETITGEKVDEGEQENFFTCSC